jgi:hypothetical protein
MNAVEKHPQRQEIIDGILAGKQLTLIAKGLQPRLHFTTIGRYRQVLLKGVTASMHGKGATSSALKELAESSGSHSTPSESLREQLQRSIVRTETRLDRWIQAAESETDPETGETRFNHRALGLHTRNGLSAIELRAKLAGLLQESANVSMQLAIGIMVGTRESEPAEVIDIEQTR